jgi:hypothetical protein
MSLIDKIRKAREQCVEVGGYTFTVRRPTDIEAMALRGASGIADLLPFVVGWSGVKEIDLLPSGDAVPAAFDADLAAEWLADRPDLLQPLVEAIMDAYRAHVAAMEEVAKN